MQTMSDGVYAIPPEHQDLRAMIRDLVQAKVAPRAGDIDRSGEYPWDVRRLLAEHDVLGLPFAEEYGGMGTGTLMLQMAVEQIAYACASSALILMIQELGSLPIQLFGDEEQKQRWLPRLATGELSPAFALSEPEAGSDPASMRTSAVRDGDGWVLNGQKNWITNASIADFYVVFATTDRERRRASAFIVEADREGFEMGRLEHKLGIKGSPTGSPTMTDVQVPADNLIGEEGRGLTIALATLERTRLGAAARAVGIAQGTTDYATRYARERVTFGTSLLDKQGIQFKLADMETRTAAARELLYKACAKIDRGEAGYGYVNEYSVERMMRDAKITQIYEGANEIQRMVVARSMR